MTNKALEHQYPAWEDDPEGDPSEPKQIWYGKMRIVRSARRMHRLKRRGVPLMHLGYGDGTASQQIKSPLGNLVPQGPWAWFETFEGHAARKIARRLLRVYGLRRVGVTMIHDEIALAFPGRSRSELCQLRRHS